MRIQITHEGLKQIFGAIRKKYDWGDVADRIGASRRNLFDWRRGKLTIPEEKYKILLKISGLKKKNLAVKKLPEFWNIVEAAKKGGRARVRLHGNFGTVEGRKLGGLRALEYHRHHDTRFTNLKRIKIPKKSAKLAEFLGILIGDGHLSEYQCSLATNSITDIQHAEFVKSTAKNIFGIESKVTLRKSQNAVTVVMSSRSLVLFLEKHGMPIGNKIIKNIGVPEWIKEDLQFKKSFLRGLFDTDGSIFLDHHRIKSKDYFHLGWAVTSYSSQLRGDIFQILEELGFRPTCRDTQKSVYIRRRKEVVRYFEQIGSHNNKHLTRFKNFVGRVPKWS